MIGTMNASLTDVLVAGLEVQGWIETASVSPCWRRFGKFGRGAMYVITETCLDTDHEEAELFAKDDLWFSPLHKTWPADKVIGPILDTLFDVGYKAIEQALPADQGRAGRVPQRRASFDADAALEELGRGE